MSLELNEREPGAVNLELAGSSSKDRRQRFRQFDKTWVQHVPANMDIVLFFMHYLMHH